MEDAIEVCSRLKPKIIFPMHYKSERCPILDWAPVDDFLEGKKNVLRCDSSVGSSELEFAVNQMPSETQIVVPRFVC